MLLKEKKKKKEKAMAPHSSTVAWKIPWTEESGRLQSMGSLRVGHDFTFTFTFHFHALEKGMATRSRVLAWRIPRMRGAWRAAVYGVAQSWTWPKRLSSSSIKKKNQSVLINTTDYCFSELFPPVHTLIFLVSFFLLHLVFLRGEPQFFLLILCFEQ